VLDSDYPFLAEQAVELQDRMKPVLVMPRGRAGGRCDVA